MDTSKTIKEILSGGDKVEIKSLYAFDSSNTTDQILVKMNLWFRQFFPRYFSSKDALFHREIDRANLLIYRGEKDQFVNAAFKGAAKTSRTKLFIAFVVCNDLDKRRKYIRVLSADSVNSTQITTDIYNMLVSPLVIQFYPEIFAKTTAKREETMSSFTTATGIKVLADTVGTSQRGALQEASRPDFVWFEDFENRTTLRSARKTIAIWENMEEARTGLAKDGGCVYTCNYISEMGNVHTLIKKPSDRKIVLVTPIVESGVLSWPDRYSHADIEQMRQDDDDFDGERLCKPSAAKDIIFDRETVDRMVPSEPIKVIADFKMFKPFDPSHRYGSGHDVAGGVGLDSSTSVFIDFDMFPAKVVATFKSNTIKPETFGDEIYREGEYFSYPITAPEKNNHGHATIARLKQLGANLYKTQTDPTKVNASTATEYGWHTNSLTKPKMIFALVKAVNDGLIDLSDADLIQECKSYTRNDLIDTEKDPRLTTRHYDLLTSCFVAGTKILTDTGDRNIEDIVIGDLVMTRNGLHRVKNVCSRKAEVVTNIGLTGTADHPVFVDDEVVDLSRVSYTDKLYTWDKSKQRIERRSYIEACLTTGTLMPSLGNTASIIMVALRTKKVPKHFIVRFGLMQMGLYLKGMLSTIKTRTLSTMSFLILKSKALVNTCATTRQMKLLNKSTEKTLPPDVTRSIKVLGIALPIHQQYRCFASSVALLLRLGKLVQCFVVENVSKMCRTREGGMKRLRKCAMFVERLLQQVYRTKKDVLMDVQKNVDVKRISTVYNIEVEDHPEYFANGILVHNCAIAFQMKDFAQVQESKHDDFIDDYQPMYSEIGI